MFRGSPGGSGSCQIPGNANRVDGFFDGMARQTSTVSPINRVLRNPKFRFRPVLAETLTMKKTITVIFAGAIFLSAGLSTSLGWGQNGHRITAEIGERNLNPQAKAAIRAIIGQETLAEIATWPDDIRSDPSWNFVQPWHYISIDDDESWEGLKRDEDGDVISALEMFEKFLRDPDKKTLTISGIVKGRGKDSGKTFEQKKEIGKREALAFYVHFAGDIHQPLHVGRRGDLGGNRVRVVWFEEELNLHKVWDESLIESAQLSFTEFATFLNRVPEAQQEEWSSSSYIDWARESKDVRPRVYDFSPQTEVDTPVLKPILSWGYRHEALPIVRDRLAKGGIRLAGKLNDIFSGYPNPGE